MSLRRCRRRASHGPKNGQVKLSFIHFHFSSRAYFIQMSSCCSFMCLFRDLFSEILFIFSLDSRAESFAVAQRGAVRIPEQWERIVLLGTPSRAITEAPSRWLFSAASLLCIVLPHFFRCFMVESHERLHLILFGKSLRWQKQEFNK